MIRTADRPAFSLVAAPTTQCSRQVKGDGMGEEYGINGGGGGWKMHRRFNLKKGDWPTWELSRRRDDIKMSL